MDSEMLNKLAFQFLDSVQASGQINMYGASPHVVKYFRKYFKVRITRRQSHQLLRQWMEFKTYWAKLEKEA